jgi:hypothetical protein
VPVIKIDTGELNSLLAIETVPELLPIVTGAKVAVRVALFPTPRVIGSVIPPMLNPVPAAIICEIVTGVVPELAIVRL